MVIPVRLLNLKKKLMLLVYKAEVHAPFNIVCNCFFYFAAEWYWKEVQWSARKEMGFRYTTAKKGCHLILTEYLNLKVHVWGTMNFAYPGNVKLLCRFKNLKTGWRKPCNKSTSEVRLGRNEIRPSGFRDRQKSILSAATAVPSPESSSTQSYSASWWRRAKMPPWR